MSKNILVTGGAGMIGSNITKKLLERGNNVIVLDDLSAYPFDYLHEFGVGQSDAEFIKGSVLDKKLVRLATKKADLVIHAAAYAMWAHAYVIIMRILPLMLKAPKTL